MIKVYDNNGLKDLIDPFKQVCLEPDPNNFEITETTPDGSTGVNKAHKKPIDIEAIFHKRLLRQLRSNKD